MDLISRKEVRRLIWRNNDKYGYSDRFHEFTDEVLNNLPSAFEGMTYKDVVKAIFPDAVVIVNDLNGTVRVVFSDEVWDSPYKGVSE